MYRGIVYYNNQLKNNTKEINVIALINHKGIKP